VEEEEVEACLALAGGIMAATATTTLIVIAAMVTAAKARTRVSKMPTPVGSDIAPFPWQ